MYAAAFVGLYTLCSYWYFVGVFSSGAFVEGGYVVRASSLALRPCGSGLTPRQFSAPPTAPFFFL